MNAAFTDPQFWIVTGAAAIALAWFVARKVRAARRPTAGCDNCPQAPPPRDRPGTRALGLVVLALLAPAAAPGETVARTVAAMGTTLAVEVEAADRSAAIALSERLIEAVGATERRLSTWRDDSELARFNRAPVGVEVALSAATFGEVVAALDCAVASGGAFDPTVAPLVAAWDLRGDGRVPDEAELARALAEVGVARLRALPERDVLVKAAPVRLEEGGFGKGAALDRALEAAARERAAILLDLGGQLAWSGRREPLVVRLADPRDRSRPVVELTLDAPAGSLATSGDSERSVTTTAGRAGHILDPRSGRPAPDFGSVAVVAAGAARADCASTALFVDGPRRGLARLRSGGGPEAVYLVVDGERLVARATPGLVGRLVPLVPELEIGNGSS